MAHSIRVLINLSVGILKFPKFHFKGTPSLEEQKLFSAAYMISCMTLTGQSDFWRYFQFHNYGNASNLNYDNTVLLRTVTLRSWSGIKKSTEVMRFLSQVTESKTI